MSAFPLRRAFLTLLGRYHMLSGRRAYRLGRLRLAGRHFREALTCGLESFEAYLLLGKIYYRENDLARAATFFARARNTDPTRYLLEGFPDDFIETLRERQHAAIADRPEYRVVIESARRPGKPATPGVPVPRAAGLPGRRAASMTMRYSGRSVSVACWRSRSVSMKSSGKPSSR